MSAHLRGKFRVSGQYAESKPVYIFEVVNTTTGEVVARDDHCGFSKGHDDLRWMVLIARGAWMLGIRHKTLVER